jgi:ATP synthase protein I
MTNTTRTQGQQPADGSGGEHPASATPKFSGQAHELEAEVEAFKPLTREEAEKFRATSRSVSPWTLVGSQLLAGLATALLAWMLTGEARMGWSASYGALAVVIPSVLFVRGLARQKNAAQGGSALAGFFVWEMVKIALTVAMLVAAPRLVNELSWLALLAGFVVTMKAYWAAVWFGLLRSKSIKKSVN